MHVTRPFDIFLVRLGYRLDRQGDTFGVSVTSDGADKMSVLLQPILCSMHLTRPFDIIFM